MSRFAETHPVADTAIEVARHVCAIPAKSSYNLEIRNRRNVSSMRSAMDSDSRWRSTDNLVLMGQDIADYGGVFKITEGFVERFGKDRVRNTPLCESAIVGTGLGLSVKGMKAMVEMQFADFVTEGFNQIVNNLAKAHWRWGQQADVVVRMPHWSGYRCRTFPLTKQ